MKDTFFGKKKSLTSNSSLKLDKYIFDVKELKMNKLIFDVKQLKMNRFIKSISQLIISTSNPTLDVLLLRPRHDNKKHNVNLLFCNKQM